MIEQSTDLPLNLQFCNEMNSFIVGRIVRVRPQASEQIICEQAVEAEEPYVAEVGAKLKGGRVCSGYVAIRSSDGDSEVQISQNWPLEDDEFNRDIFAKLQAAVAEPTPCLRNDAII